MGLAHRQGIFVEDHPPVNNPCIRELILKFSDIKLIISHLEELDKLLDKHSNLKRHRFFSKVNRRHHDTS
jgi:hypothetical protein